MRQRTAAKPGGLTQEGIKNGLDHSNEAMIEAMGCTTNRKFVCWEAQSQFISLPVRIFTRGQFLEAVHGVAVESYERAIDAHVKSIRRKIEADPRRPRYLLTVHGIGYKFAEE